MRYIFDSDRLDERFWQLLDEADPRDRLYVYRVVDGKPARPALLVGQPFPDLMGILRDEHQGGEFEIMIRRGERMLLSGVISIEVPLPRR
jgi:hypothetical protein